MSVKNRAKDEMLGDLHIAVAEDLLARVRSGEASPQELAAAIKFLANNKIEVVTVEGSAIDRLVKALPEFDDDDQQVTTH